MIRLPQNSNCIIYFLFRIDHVMAGLHMYAAFKKKRQWRNFVIFNEDVYVPENITFLKGGSSWHCLYYIQQIRSFKKCKNRGKIHYMVPWPLLKHYITLQIVLASLLSTTSRILAKHSREFLQPLDRCQYKATAFLRKLESRVEQRHLNCKSGTKTNSDSMAILYYIVHGIESSI